MPATAMPLTARQINAGSSRSLNAMPKHASALSTLLARKMVRAGSRSVSATRGNTATM
jgi:phage FluMu protein gp41